MTTTTTIDPAARPKHGFTKDGTPVYGRTHRYMKMDTAAQRVNAAIGLRITLLVGTMWAAYVFALIAFVSLPSTIKQHSATVLVLWLSSEFIQLVLLPIIIVGQNIQSRAADARATKTFEDVEDARQKIEHAINLLDVHTDGGLHDAVVMIVDAINAKAASAAPAPPAAPAAPASPASGPPPA
jgi:hypothetical protein